MRSTSNNVETSQLGLNFYVLYRQENNPEKAEGRIA